MNGNALFSVSIKGRMIMKYSDQIADWLVELGYTHCFYVSGGNIMHLLESFSRKLDCRAVIHEVAAGIAAEYFNESSPDKKALALVTAGPGLTNIITALGGAYLESRELLVIGGQVKTADLARGKLRQRGIQEIDGVAIAKPVTVRSILLDEVCDFNTLEKITGPGDCGRKGPVFIEIPLDIQAREVSFDKTAQPENKHTTLPRIAENELDRLVEAIENARRPMLLLGGGVSRKTTDTLQALISQLTLPIATTWNAADRLDARQENYVGRPNTWGQRSANLIMQQSDLLVACGTRLGMQQTGFNWAQFVPNGRVAQVEIDPAELEKGHPRVDFPLLADADNFLERLVTRSLGDHSEWLAYAKKIRQLVPNVEPVNITGNDFISPYEFVEKLSDLCTSTDVIVPCSSGSAFTTMMQAFRQKKGQIIITDKGLASMGYGLSGAIGASFSNPDSRVILVEGDGGFAQNLQEIGTAAINNINLKIFIFDDSGYASIRMTQRNYFGGKYVGCDRNTGLGLPDWEKLFPAWGVPVMRMGANYASDTNFIKLLNSKGTAAFIVPIDPEQTYFPKITSRVTSTGAMESNPLHLMTPELPGELFGQVTLYL
jgi:acetolactate synthase-1/2/3 large subunit